MNPPLQGIAGHSMPCPYAPVAKSPIQNQKSKIVAAGTGEREKN
jgi:hypothetical protein